MPVFGSEEECKGVIEMGGRRGRKDRVNVVFFLTSYEIVSMFNFKFILNIKHWIQCDELFSRRQQKVSSLTFSYFMYSNHLQTS